MNVRIGYRFMYRDVPHENFITASLRAAVALFPCMRSVTRLKQRIVHHRDTANMNAVALHSLAQDAPAQAIDVGMVPEAHRDRLIGKPREIARGLGLEFWVAPEPLEPPPGVRMPR